MDVTNRTNSNAVRQSRRAVLLEENQLLHDAGLTPLPGGMLSGDIVDARRQVERVSISDGQVSWMVARIGKPSATGALHGLWLLAGHSLTTTRASALTGSAYERRSPPGTEAKRFVQKMGAVIVPEYGPRPLPHSVNASLVAAFKARIAGKPSDPRTVGGPGVHVDVLADWAIAVRVLLVMIAHVRLCMRRKRKPHDPLPVLGRSIPFHEAAEMAWPATNTNTAPDLLEQWLAIEGILDRWLLNTAVRPTTQYRPNAPSRDTEPPRVDVGRVATRLLARDPLALAALELAHIVEHFGPSARCSICGEPFAVLRPRRVPVCAAKACRREDDKRRKTKERSARTPEKKKADLRAARDGMRRLRAALA